MNLSISAEILMYLQCPNGGEGSTRVCAATGGSFDEKDKWFIFLSPKGLNVGESIQFKCKNSGLKEIFEKVNGSALGRGKAEK
eukprot:CAMPEP_0116938108 /NCGR_PEP_ID=MMETSP0467-20121206/31912_1 /TAXON_ID=283647 /ORGANISM="Mesodinium pulex, Strain SPMC105" /LENGTH=82 /DNA_ID=CAMNT_0004620069 /DNA_START=547 /DNA_END=795 /DNA_ORIENTATION=-